MVAGCYPGSQSSQWSWPEFWAFMASSQLQGARCCRDDTSLVCLLRTVEQSCVFRHCADTCCRFVLKFFRHRLSSTERWMQLITQPIQAPRPPLRIASLYWAPGQTRRARRFIAVPSPKPEAARAKSWKHVGMPRLRTSRSRADCGHELHGSNCNLVVRGGMVRADCRLPPCTSLHFSSPRPGLFSGLW